MVSRYIRANVLGFVAIFLALGGIGIAAGLPKNSVKSKQIKDGQVKTADIAADAIDSSKVANGSLTGADFGGTLPAGAQGPQGPAGPPGPPGALGSAGGDLTGSYPNPEIAAGAVGGDEVGGNALTGADIDESTLFNDDSLHASDVDEQTLFNDDSLTGDDVDESTLFNDDSLNGSDISDDAIGGGELAGGAVEPANIANIPAARAVGLGQSNGAGSCGAGYGVNAFTYEPLYFRSERFDVGDMHTVDGVCQNAGRSRLTAPRPGIYQISAGVVWPENATGFRYLEIRANGGTTPPGTFSAPQLAADMRAAAPAPGVVGTVQNVSALTKMNQGEYVEAVVYHNVGGGLGLPAFDERTFLSMVWVGPH